MQTPVNDGSVWVLVCEHALVHCLFFECVGVDVFGCGCVCVCVCVWGGGGGGGGGGGRKERANERELLCPFVCGRWSMFLTTLYLVQLSK